ncbi:MAG: hypothetical protein RLZZ144_730, partial [Pseudomonadota bacterium]
MIDNSHRQRTENVQEQLAHIQRLLEQSPTIDESTAEISSAEQALFSNSPPLTESALSQKLNELHSADVAYILEALPLEQRQLVWDLVKAE